MTPGSFRFEDFVLDPGERQLRREGVPVELNSRYLDALALLVSEPGRLVSKDRFLQEVWEGVPVTDEALTQCIRTLRRQLGDDAARPRFIETVPKHGYRFIAPVARGTEEPPSAAVGSLSEAQASRFRQLLLLGGAGAAGGGAAGALGGLLYGFVAASQALQPGSGAISVLLVLVCLATLIGLMGGAGVGFGIAAASLAAPAAACSVAGGALGGMAVGAVVKLLGLDAFDLLLGQSPGDVTGAPEGALLGGAVGLGAWLASRGTGRLKRSLAATALAGGAAGALIPWLGGRLMAGSLELLGRRFPESRLRLDLIGGLFGEPSFGLVSQAVTGALEGALFSACVVGAMALACNRLGAASPP